MFFKLFHFILITIWILLLCPIHLFFSVIVFSSTNFSLLTFCFLISHYYWLTFASISTLLLCIGIMLSFLIHNNCITVVYIYLILIMIDILFSWVLFVLSNTPNGLFSCFLQHLMRRISFQQKIDYYLNTHFYTLKNTEK